jgi:hypothetical protein
VDGVYSPWERDAEGRWQSAEIPVLIGLEGMLATVYTRDGIRLPHEGEYGAELARRDEEIARQASELERLRAKLNESDR